MKFKSRAKRSLAACFLFVTFMAPGKIWSNETTGSKTILNNEIAVEHLEVIKPLRGSQYAHGYFTIWNGTDTNIYLTQITNGTGRNFNIQKYEKESQEPKWQNIGMPKLIPPKSEFVVASGLFRLVVDALALSNSENDKLDMRFQFANQDSIGASALVLPFGTDPTDHHHGLNDDG
ncbi:hypothetical protein [Ahrensia marina]|uniref:Copper chaperone PCu(A)C n=1 Tax=Ahrensia marina TaxID=1514904 RepID=A0A0M9GL89_9HYPH|nr:hypothetical protein [Ahrensia marina]KPB00056.1 hypothetical protein SU32_15910 [Ahrensia marina]